MCDLFTYSSILKIISLLSLSFTNLILLSTIFFILLTSVSIENNCFGDICSCCMFSIQFNVLYALAPFKLFMLSQPFAKQLEIGKNTPLMLLLVNLVFSKYKSLFFSVNNFLFSPHGFLPTLSDVNESSRLFINSV